MNLQQVIAMSPSFFLQVILLLPFFAAVDAYDVEYICHFRNGSQANSKTAAVCWDAFLGVAGLCCQPGDLCLANTLCAKPASSSFYAGFCTEPGWSSIGCLQFCAQQDVPVSVHRCMDNPAMWYCSNLEIDEPCVNPSMQSALEPFRLSGTDKSFYEISEHILD